MRTRFNQSFKIQAVEKALQRGKGTSVLEVAKSLGVGYSTLNRWMMRSRKHELEPVLPQRQSMTKEKRPEEWSLEERLEMVIRCSSLDDQAVSELCRGEGIYPHHVKQWKLDIVNGTGGPCFGKHDSQAKSLKKEIKDLKRELNRKDKALAETAALLVLQKKVNAIWGIDEDNSQ